MFDKFGNMSTDNLDITALPHWSFGDSPQMADELIELVLDGKKRATCTALHWHLDEPAHPVGNLQVITNGQNRPRCVIQNTAQFIIRFCDVDEKLARQEGEGDLSLDFWRTAHQEFFERFGIFDDKMWLLFETFDVIKMLDTP